MGWIFGLLDTLLVYTRKRLKRSHPLLSPKRTTQLLLLKCLISAQHSQYNALFEWLLENQLDWSEVFQLFLVPLSE